MNQSIDPKTVWEIREEYPEPGSLDLRFPANPTEIKKNESLFSQGNGYCGFRGNWEEGSPSGVEGTYLNGFYEQERIQYGEIAYGYAENGQTMLNVANAKRLLVRVDGQEFSVTEAMQAGQVEHYSRSLSMRTGMLHREVIWKVPGAGQGHRVQLEYDRLVSFVHPHIAAIRVRVTPLEQACRLELHSLLDGSVTNLRVEEDPRVGSGLKGNALTCTELWAEGAEGGLAQQTAHSQLALGCAMVHATRGSFTAETGGDHVTCSGAWACGTEEPIEIVKYIAYTRGKSGEGAALCQDALREAREAAAIGFDALVSEQEAFLERFWERADVQIEGDPQLLQGIRFNMFHLLQSAGRDGTTNIAAKGLTGEGYEGHYFWDTETYVLPMMMSCAPEVARELLRYRYSILENARRRARQMGHPRGALFPWRTIGGDECSAYYPAGTAQYHINADIAFAVKRYVAFTGDEDFLIRYGAEMLAETARLWADLGFYNPRREGRFCIHGVTGPDEYNAIVDNNCYTNLMAGENLRYAAQVLRWMEEKAPREYRTLADRIGLSPEEPAEWERAAAAMYVPYDAASGIYPQDDGFLDRVPWDLNTIPREHFPLLLHYHPLVIYRHQVCKQADLILAMLLLHDRFTREEKQRNFAFYDRVTTHDSSLSMGVFSILASEIGESEKAYEYFAHTARFDLDDFHGNTGDGLHMANMAGTWMGIVQGFAGMRQDERGLSFHPVLPARWQGYRFRISWRGSCIEVHVTPAGSRYRLIFGAPVTVRDNGHEIVVGPEEPCRCEEENRQGGLQ